MHRMRIAPFVICLLVLTASSRGGEPIPIDFPITSMAGTSMEERGAPVNALFVSGGHSLAEFSVDTGRLSRRRDFQDLTLSAIASVPDSARLLISGADFNETGFVGVLRETTGDFLWRDDALPGLAVCQAVAADVCFVGDDHGFVTAWNIATGQRQWSKQLHSKMVTCLVVINSRLCASADWGGKIIVFHREDGSEFTNFQQHRGRVTALGVPQVAADGPSGPPHLFSAARDGTVRLWYPTQRRLVRFVQLPEPITCMVTLPEDRVIVATKSARLHRVDMQTAKVLDHTQSNLDYIATAQRLPNQRLLVSNGRSELEIVTLAAPPISHSGAAVSPP